MSMMLLGKIEENKSVFLCKIHIFKISCVKYFVKQIQHVFHFILKDGGTIQNDANYIFCGELKCPFFDLRKELVKKTI